MKRPSVWLKLSFHQSINLAAWPRTSFLKYLAEMRRPYCSVGGYIGKLSEFQWYVNLCKLYTIQMNDSTYNNVLREMIKNSQIYPKLFLLSSAWSVAGRGGDARLDMWRALGHVTQRENPIGPESPTSPSAPRAMNFYLLLKMKGWTKFKF